MNGRGRCRSLCKCIQRRLFLITNLCSETYVTRFFISPFESSHFYLWFYSDHAVFLFIHYKPHFFAFTSVIKEDILLPLLVLSASPSGEPREGGVGVPWVSELVLPLRGTRFVVHDDLVKRRVKRLKIRDVIKRNSAGKIINGVY